MSKGLTTCLEEREILLGECADKCKEILGEFGGDIWEKVYTGVMLVAVSLDTTAQIAIHGYEPPSESDLLSRTCSEELFQFVHRFLMELPDGQRG